MALKIDPTNLLSVEQYLTVASPDLIQVRAEHTAVVQASLDLKKKIHDTTEAHKNALLLKQSEQEKELVALSASETEFSAKERELLIKTTILECQDKKFYKIMNAAEEHHDYKYHDGWNILQVPFDSNPRNSCCKGGFYVTTLQFLMKFLGYGVTVREVSLPFGHPAFQMIKDSDGDKWRCNILYLDPKKKYPLQEVATFEMLAERGCDFKNRKILSWALQKELTYPIMIYLIENDLLNESEVMDIWIGYSISFEMQIFETLSSKKSVLQKIPKQAIMTLTDQLFPDHMTQFNLILTKCDGLVTPRDIFEHFIENNFYNKLLALLETKIFYNLTPEDITKLKKVVNVLNDDNTIVNYLRLMTSMGLFIFDNEFCCKQFFRNIFDQKYQPYLDFIIANSDQVSIRIIQKMCHRCIGQNKTATLREFLKKPLISINYVQLLIKCMKYGNTLGYSLNEFIEKIPTSEIDYEKLFVTGVIHRKQSMIGLLRCVSPTAEVAFQILKNSLLKIAHMQGITELTRYLLQEKADISIYRQITLQQINECSDKDVAKIMLSPFVGIGTINLVQICTQLTTKRDHTILFSAEIRALLKLFSDPEYHNEFVRVAQWTVLYNDLNALEMIVTTLNIDLHADGEKLLELAISNNNQRIVEFLIERGCNPNHPNIQTVTRQVNNKQLIATLKAAHAKLVAAHQKLLQEKLAQESLESQQTKSS